MQIEQEQIDTLDKKLLNEIQWTFPLVQRRCLEIGRHHGISETEVMERIARLKKNGLVREINAIFDTRNLGYKSALVAFAIRPEMLDFVANEVNKHPGVSHNYERNHEFNMWFTMAVPPGGDMKRDLDNLSVLDGVIKYRLLPTLKLYKIGVRLDMVNDDPKKPLPEKDVKKIDPKKF